MPNQGRYIMREQSHDAISSIMKYDVTRRTDKSDRVWYLLSVATVTFVYLLAMAISGS